MEIELVNQILKDYEIGHYSVEKVSDNINSVCKIASESGGYLLKVYDQDYDRVLFGDKIYSKEALTYEMEYLNTLRDNNLFVQKPIRNIGGEYVTKCEDTLSILTEWVDGKEADVKELTLKDYSVIGTLLARMHGISMKYSNIAKQCPRLPFDERRLDTFIHRISLGCKNGIFDNRVLQVAINAVDKIKRKMKEMSIGKNLMGLIHGDFYSYNLVKQNSQFIPIDFELSSYGYYYQDLAAICNENSNEDLINEFLQAYQNELNLVINFDYLKVIQAYLTLFYLAANYNKQGDYRWVDTLL